MPKENVARVGYRVVSVGDVHEVTRFYRGEKQRVVARYSSYPVADDVAEELDSAAEWEI